MAKRACFAAVRREFYMPDGSHDGGETEFMYEGDPIAAKLRECSTLAEAIAILGPQQSPHYGRIEVTEVQTYKGKLP